MKGFTNLSDATLDKLLPLVEITKSRRSKNNPGGAISKCTDRMLERLNGRSFIADLCGLRAFQNPEISTLLDPENAFENWTTFVRKEMPDSCIPVVHLTEPHSNLDFLTQAKRTNRSMLAVRIPTEYPYLDELAASMSKLAENGIEIVALADASYVSWSSRKSAAEACAGVLRAVADAASILAPLSSSFPSSVMNKGLGGTDSYGELELSEVFISESIKNELAKRNVWHSDYSLTYPINVEGVVTNWVPRVDVPLDKSFYYYRYRRGNGGYVRAASEALLDSSFAPLPCWGEVNIREAAEGSPQGMSPAHWIAVRINMHITRQCKRLT
jgi:hypothetical protein